MPRAQTAQPLGRKAIGSPMGRPAGPVSGCGSKLALLATLIAAGGCGNTRQSGIFAGQGPLVAVFAVMLPLALVVAIVLVVRTSKAGQIDGGDRRAWPHRVSTLR